MPRIKVGGAIQNAEGRDMACREIVKMLGTTMEKGTTQMALRVIMDRDDKLTSDQLWSIALLMHAVGGGN